MTARETYKQAWSRLRAGTFDDFNVAIDSISDKASQDFANRKDTFDGWQNLGRAFEFSLKRNHHLIVKCLQPH